MFKRSICIACAVLFIAALVCAQEGPEGHWEGSIPVYFDVNRQMGISLDLSQNAKSEWVASMGVPALNAAGLVVQSVKVNGTSVSFVAVEMIMMTKFDMTLGAGGIMKGTITAQQWPPNSASVEFKRTGAAKVALIPVSPAVSKELEGDWEGTLVVVPGASLPMIFHFKNQPDKTVLAIMDSPARNAVAIFLNDVKQSGCNVEFGMKVPNATFKGTLNPEGTELSGQFAHEQDVAQLTLKKGLTHANIATNANSTITCDDTAAQRVFCRPNAFAIETNSPDQNRHCLLIGKHGNKGCGPENQGYDSCICLAVPPNPCTIDNQATVFCLEDTFAIQQNYLNKNRKCLLVAQRGNKGCGPENQGYDSCICK
jgi:hypothetical protein